MKRLAECDETLGAPRWVRESYTQVLNNLDGNLHFMQLSTNHIAKRYSIRARNNENGALVGKYCGNTTLPPPVIAPTPYMWLRWKTDFSLVDLGFWLSYDCGGILTEDNGVVTSPNFPFNYNHSDFCAWQIIGPEGYQVKIDFTDFNVEHHPSCRWDSVDILNGPLPTSPSVGPFCGETLPGTLNKTFISQSNAVRVLFKTDSSVHRNGFRFRYSFSSGGCSGIYHSNSGVIKTPNYDATPGDYPHNAECMWDINVEDGYHVVLTFKPPFDLEAHASCAFDYVEVSDALPNGTLVSLGRWCGLTTPPVLKSTGARMVAKFRSDATTRGHGFAANWTAGCGAIFTEDSGSFISPGYPNAYVDNLRCNYTIATDPQRFVVLEFDSLIFAIEGGANCPYDYVQAFPGNDSSGRSLGKFCGTTVPQPVSSLGSMFVQFVTDSSIQNKGFRALYSVSDCGGVFTDPDGIIKTPTHPVNYHHNANCTWNITVENNRVVDLKFLSFDLEAHSTCRYDYVEIFDGGSLTSPSMGKFCGQTLPPLLRTTGNTMLVNFVSDYNVAAKGFSAAYRTTFGVNQGCGGVLNSTSGTLKAVDIDNDGEYENALDCKWVIIVGDNQVVRFIVTGMDIEAHSRCMYDYLLIHDGMSEDDPIIGRYCGTQAPPAIQATSNTLYIRFFSDYTVTKAGFNATYTQEDALCGGAFTATTDPVVITSPSFPGSLSQSLKCRWTIDTPEENQQVRLFLTSINLINDNNCSQEYLEFRDSPLGWTGRSIHFCGSQVPSSSFDSAGRTVNINYVISANSGSQGFSLKYQIASCNKTYTGSSGRILSPGWPGNYQSNSNCEIAVSAPAGNYISLYFNSFYIEPHPNCRFDYLQIHNGSSADSPVITQLCGNTLPNPVFATGNTIWMNFMTDASVTHPGFDISWTATPQGIGCGGELTGINGSLTSPNYPGNYTERHSCRWIITVPRRRIVTLMFTDINLLGSADCERAYVEVFNGNIDSAPSFGRFCGNEIPARLQTSGNTALVKFISDGFHSAPGFRLKFTS
ncbi:hypothetical protein FSP39_008473 [Pinctada imbricata]|uniref:CUB domain-containing protein n=1 Tax=Pinctada imbricata TaxID=66713 RepID=A0AA88YJB7_PINIB|nr:hypothetical protein FSP39_008473 [Pinctada imbricata]